MNCICRYEMGQACRRGEKRSTTQRSRHSIVPSSKRRLPGSVWKVLDNGRGADYFERLLLAAKTHWACHITLSQDSEEKPYE
jgi:hypothetical protein